MAITVEYCRYLWCFDDASIVGYSGDLLVATIKLVVTDKFLGGRCKFFPSSNSEI